MIKRITVGVLALAVGVSTGYTLVGMAFDFGLLTP